MSPREASEATGIHKLTILKWIRSGKLAAEKIQTSNGIGYDIRPEDLTQAISIPRKKKESAPAPPRGSVVEKLDAMEKMQAEKLEIMEQLIRDQGEAAARQQEAMQAEIHDLRAQLHQTETRLKETMLALPAPEATPAPKAPGFFARFKKGNR
jgi:excisionase family DNA binding protein